MTSPTTSNPCSNVASFDATLRYAAHKQGGVVLIISMILLVIISLLAVTSLRNAGSAESVAGNIRTTEMARQSAEIALRHCEQSVNELIAVANGAAPKYTTTFALSDILAFTTPPAWSARNTTTNALTNWDVTPTTAYILPIAMVNDIALGVSYKRPPECMVEELPVLLPSATAPTVSTSFLITARGFGPEVAAADASRSRPMGTEVWMQSTIQID